VSELEDKIVLGDPISLGARELQEAVRRVHDAETALRESKLSYPSKEAGEFIAARAEYTLATRAFEAVLAHGSFRAKEGKA
jgi:hypothetical protein